MPRGKDRHPLGKVAEGKRFEITIPTELWERLEKLAFLQGKSETEWARDQLEKSVEGEWLFTKRRFPQIGGDDNGKNTR